MAATYMTARQVASKTDMTEAEVLAAMRAAKNHPETGVQIKRHGPHRGKLCYQGKKSLENVVRLARSPRVQTPTGAKANRHPVPLVVVEPAEFAEACLAAIRNATGVSLRRSRSIQQEGLMVFDIDVTASGVTHPIRLDLACAMAKRAATMPYDAYGERIAGVVPMHNGKGWGDRWLITYDLSGGMLANSPASASIDHVIPRAKGGPTALCNLQLMRTSANSHKSDTPMPDVSGEPQESMAVLGTLAAGCRDAMDAGTLDAATGRMLLGAIRVDVTECLAALSGPQVAASVARSVAGRVASSVRRAAGGAAGRASLRRVALRAAARMLVAG